MRSLRSNTRRLLLPVLLLLILVTGVWWRAPVPFERESQTRIVAVEYAQPRDWPAGLTVEGVWALSNPDLRFGGYSALLTLGEGRALAFSDRGDSMAFTLPGHAGRTPSFARAINDRRFNGSTEDIESATRDPVTGSYWLAYEHANAISRLAPGTPPLTVRPEPMKGWPGNGGAEAMARFADGRFLVLGETNHEGLLFEGDPVDRPAFRRFRMEYPEGFRPTDAAQLPDGRVLVLLRRVALGWPPFNSRLAIADPSEASVERPWRVHELAKLDGPLPRENYEGIAVEPEGDAIVIWLISDDNLSAFQRTLLVRLSWRDEAIGASGAANTNPAE